MLPTGPGFSQLALIAAKAGKTTDPHIGQFFREATLWQRFGLRREDLQQRSWMEIEELLDVAQALHLVEQAESERLRNMPAQRTA